jgi:Fe-S cluster assembly iron-binding protein IscA
MRLRRRQSLATLKRSTEVSTMVTVTERAKEKLKELLQGETDDPSLGLRLVTTPSGEIGMFADRERDDDQIVEYQGSAVLLVNEGVASTIGDATIDYDDSDPGPRLVMTRDS